MENELQAKERSRLGLGAIPLLRPVGPDLARPLLEAPDSLLECGEAILHLEIVITQEALSATLVASEAVNARGGPSCGLEQFTWQSKSCMPTAAQSVRLLRSSGSVRLPSVVNWQATVPSLRRVEHPRWVLGGSALPLTRTQQRSPVPSGLDKATTKMGCANSDNRSIVASETLMQRIAPELDMYVIEDLFADVEGVGPVIDKLLGDVAVSDRIRVDHVR